MGTARTQRNIVEGVAPAPQGVGSAIPVPESGPSAAEDRSAMPRSGTRSSKEGPAMSAAVRDAATVSALISCDGGPMSASASPDKAAAAARTAGKGESGVTPEEGKTVGTAALPRAERPSARKIRINFRPFLFAACGLIFGIMLYHRIAFGGFVPSDALFFALFLPLALVRRTRRIFLCALAVLAVGASCGAGASHLYAQRFCGGVPAGEYVVSGTVVSVAAGNGYCTATMGSLSFDGVSVGGKLQVTLPVEWVDPAERLSFTADVARTPLPDGADAYAQTLYASDVRYTASCSHMMSEGRSVNPFLRLNAAIHALLTEHMERDEAELCYALLTGNSRNLDSGFLEETRSAGIAHIFAVSGLHIGILYGAALVVFRFCRRYAALPAIAAAVCYSALCGFTVSALHLPGKAQEWENDKNTAADCDCGKDKIYGAPSRIATPLSIMTEGPIGAASFNNEFGRANILGYFRAFEARVGDTRYGYHKPIMLAGGIGNIRDDQTKKLELPAGTLLIVLGGPGMRIGLGGGAASSMTSGSNAESLDFDSVQRGNPEMERRAQEVIDRCWSCGKDNPILAIHDIGAGGLSNAMPELADLSGHGARLSLDKVPVEEKGMSPLEVWCNESQERYALAIAPQSLEKFDDFCRRERCPYAVLGSISEDGELIVEGRAGEDRAVQMPMEVLLGKPPRMHRNVTSVKQKLSAFKTDVSLKEALYRVLKHPTVANKSFLISIGDRSVGGLVCRDQMVGPWQVPVADCAVTCVSFASEAGEAMAIGERTPVAIIDSAAASRMAVGEALTNIAAADIDLPLVKLSANWMAACGAAGRTAKKPSA